MRRTPLARSPAPAKTPEGGRCAAAGIAPPPYGL